MIYENESGACHKVQGSCIKLWGYHMKRLKKGLGIWKIQVCRYWKNRLAAALIIAGLTVAAGNGTSPLLAWWGTLYPQFCMAGEYREKEETEPERDEITLRFHFWLLEFLTKERAGGAGL